ncbi:MAG: pantetheine-phosphate adenylyltransferase [Rickettsiales bacterium]
MATEREKKIGVYAGTFDPITNGHIDILKRSLRVFDLVYVAVAISSGKTTAFTVAERMDLVNQAIKSEVHSTNVVVSEFDGLLVEFVKKVGAVAIIRGLRAVSDYEYEAQMALINRKLFSETETVFFVASENCSYISSSIVKNVASNGGDVSALVPAVVRDRLKAKF